MEQEYKIKRRYERHRARVTVVYKDSDKNQTWETIDIAEGGMSIETKNPPFVGEILNLEIKLGKSEEIIDTKAEVMWRREGVGCGLQFFKLTAKEKALLLDFLQKVASQQK